MHFSRCAALLSQNNNKKYKQKRLLSFLVTGPMQLFSPSYNPDSSTAYVHDGISGLCEGTVNFLFFFLLYLYRAIIKINIYKLRTVASPH